MIMAERVMFLERKSGNGENSVQFTVSPEAQIVGAKEPFQKQSSQNINFVSGILQKSSPKK